MSRENNVLFSIFPSFHKLRWDLQRKSHLSLEIIFSVASATTKAQAKQHYCCSHDPHQSNDRGQPKESNSYQKSNSRPQPKSHRLLRWCKTAICMYLWDQRTHKPLCFLSSRRSEHLKSSNSVPTLSS